MSALRVGFALCGSFCTFSKVIPEIDRLAALGYDLYPIMSGAAWQTNTRFGAAADYINHLEEICGKPVIKTIEQAEPIGPRKLLDVLVVAPCTGNTIAKLAHAISDSPVTLAVKSHLRNARPIVIAVSSNDALSANAVNIGSLLARKNIFFVPFGQDDPIGKPYSMLADMTKIEDTVNAALEGRQLQPILV